MYLGIDPGTKLGWALLRDDGTRYLSGTTLLPHNKQEPGRRFREALKQFEWHILTLRKADPITLIGYEHVRRWASSDAALVYNGIVACLFMAAAEHNIPVVGYAPTSLKKLYAGHGKASKEEMIMAAEKHFGIKVTDDNEADALWVAYHTYKTHKT